MITPKLIDITGLDTQSSRVNFNLKDVTGTMTLGGTNLATQTSGSRQIISGNIATIVDIDLTSTLSTSRFQVKANYKDGITLGSLESPNPMATLCLGGIDLVGLAQLVAPGLLRFGKADNATIDIMQNIPTFTLKGHTWTSSMVNVTSGTLASSLNLDLHTGIDTLFSTTEIIPRLKLDSFTETGIDTGGITAGGIGSFMVKGNYTADLNLNSLPTLKYALDDFNAKGTASGNWNIRGAVNLIYAKTFDTNFNGTFGGVKNFRVGTNFSGSFSAGFLDKGNIGDDMIGATMNFTNPFSTNAQDLGFLHVGNTIEDSSILSDGNVGSISTMYSYFSNYGAGVSPSYVFGQPLGPSDYTSNSIIGSIIIDCPSHHNIHFVGSTIGAYGLWNVQLGNVQTDNSGVPFGLAGYQMDHVAFRYNSRLLTFPSLNSTAEYDAGLQKYGYTPGTLGDFSLQFQF